MPKTDRVETLPKEKTTAVIQGRADIRDLAIAEMYFAKQKIFIRSASMLVRKSVELAAACGMTWEDIVLDSYEEAYYHLVKCGITAINKDNRAYFPLNELMQKQKSAGRRAPQDIEERIKHTQQMIEESERQVDIEKMKENAYQVLREQGTLVNEPKIEAAEIEEHNSHLVDRPKQALDDYMTELIDKKGSNEDD